LADPVPHHKSSGGANIHNVELTQLICDDAWPKSSMAPDIDSSQKDDQRHGTLISDQSELD
jgi:hypothetical protein